MHLLCILATCVLTTTAFQGEGKKKNMRLDRALEKLLAPPPGIAGRRHVLERASVDRFGGRTGPNKGRKTFLESRGRPEGLVRRRRGRKTRESRRTEGNLVGALNQLLRRDKDDANSRNRPRNTHTVRKRKHKNREANVYKAIHEIGKENAVIRLNGRRRRLADRVAVFGVIGTKSRNTGQRRRGPRLRLETTIQKPFFSQVVHEARKDKVVEISYENADMAKQQVGLYVIANRNTEAKKVHEKENTDEKIEKKIMFLSLKTSVKDIPTNGDESGKAVKLEYVAEVASEKEGDPDIHDTTDTIGLSQESSGEVNSDMDAAENEGFRSLVELKVFEELKKEIETLKGERRRTRGDQSEEEYSNVLSTDWKSPEGETGVWGQVIQRTTQTATTAAVLEESILSNITAATQTKANYETTATTETTAVTETATTDETTETTEKATTAETRTTSKTTATQATSNTPSTSSESNDKFGGEDDSASRSKECGPRCRNRVHEEKFPEEEDICPKGMIIDVWGYCRWPYLSTVRDHSWWGAVRSHQMLLGH